MSTAISLKLVINCPLLGNLEGFWIEIPQWQSMSRNSISLLKRVKRQTPVFHIFWCNFRMWRPFPSLSRIRRNPGIQFLCLRKHPLKGSFSHRTFSFNSMLSKTFPSYLFVRARPSLKVWILFGQWVHQPTMPTWRICNRNMMQFPIFNHSLWAAIVTWTRSSELTHHWF